MYKNSVLIKTSKLLFPFLWPKKRKDLKIRVIFALFSMVIAKIASVYTPLILGDAVDSLTDLSSGINLLLYVPIAIIISYGFVRIASFAFNSNLIFASHSCAAVPFKPTAAADLVLSLPSLVLDSATYNSPCGVLYINASSLLIF